MNARAFVIHLARAEARRPQVERLLASLPFAPTVLDAVDAQTLTDAEIGAAYRRRLHRPFYPFELRRTEIACFLSHRQAWRRIVDEGLDAGLVVEDDVAVDRDALDRILAVAAPVLRPEDYLRFPQRLRDERGSALVSAGEVSVIEPRLPGRRMFMQWVGREAARRLIDATAPFDRPVDTLLQMRWLLPVRMLAARPVCVQEMSGALGGTTIQTKARPFGETLARELRRPLYKLALRWHAGAAAGRP